MVSKKNGRRYLLICCEGKTEREYFLILRRLYRISAAQVSIIGEKGQHKILIDRTIEERDRLCEDMCIDQDEVECWAVCDDDSMPFPYAELKDYAEKREVKLAFSRPQFEAYLLQHFEQSSLYDQEGLYERLSDFASSVADQNEKYDKADLKWLGALIDAKPKLVDTALVNANQRTKQSRRVFLTVQNLVRRMKELSKH